MERDDDTPAPAEEALEVERFALDTWTAAWESLSPAERLARAWALRARLRDPQDAHDRKLFPAP